MTDELYLLLGGEAPEGLPESVAQDLERALQQALEAQKFGEVAEWIDDLPTPTSKDFRPRFLKALLMERVEDDPRRPASAFRALALDLADRGYWEAVRVLTLRALKLHADDRLARLLVRTWEHLEPSPQRAEDLAFARDRCPEAPELLWDAALQADAQGAAPLAAQLACRALVGFAQAKRAEEAEEALMRALESDADADFLSVVQALPTLAAAGMVDLVNNALEFLEAEIDARQLAEPLAGVLESILLEYNEYGKWRPLYVRLLVALQGGEDRVGTLIRCTGLSDPDTPFAQARERFREIGVLSAGKFAEHGSWGVGRVVSNDGESVILDFADRQGHRMGIDMALRSLTPLSPALLRVRAFADPEGLRQEAESDPPTVLVQALKEIGGSGSTGDLRRILEGTAVSPGGWTRWWTKAKKALTDDPRIDDSEAFRQRYRLGSEDDPDSLSLPALDASKGLRPAVAFIGRLLKQHPALEDPAITAYGTELAVRVSTETDPLERVAVLPLLTRWLPDRRSEWIRIFTRLLGEGVGVVSLTAEADQLALLALGTESEAWFLTGLTALPSRFDSVREQALSMLVARGGEGLRDRLLEALKDTRAHPNETVAVVGLALGGTEPLKPLAETAPWELFMGLLTALSVDVSETTRKRGLSLLKPGGPFALRLQQTPCPDSLTELAKLAVVRQGMGLPVIERLSEFLTSADLADLAALTEAKLAPEEDDVADDGLARAGMTAGLTYMTKATHARRKQQLRDLQYQLRVELPRAIKAARELGDLSENAEYHAAREAQSIVASQVAALQQMLESVGYIEDLKPEEELITLGCEVKVRHLDTNETQTVWLLGEGDDHYGPEVISYTAELGAALLGHKAGEEVTMEIDGHVSRLEIEAFQRKLPDSES